MSIELKIKSKHLALEPAIIRKEEQKLLKRIQQLKAYHQINDHWDSIIAPVHHKWWDLQHHRKWDVRNESRATYIARAYIKGIPYRTAEQKSEFNDTFKRFILPRVFDMVAKYGKVHVRKYWDGKKQDYRPEEKEKLMSEIKSWLGME